MTLSETEGTIAQMLHGFARAPGRELGVFRDLCEALAFLGRGHVPEGLTTLARGYDAASAGTRNGQTREAPTDVPSGPLRGGRCRVLHHRSVGRRPKRIVRTQIGVPYRDFPGRRDAGVDEAVELVLQPPTREAMICITLHYKVH